MLLVNMKSRNGICMLFLVFLLVFSCHSLIMGGENPSVQKIKLKDHIIRANEDGLAIHPKDNNILNEKEFKEYVNNMLKKAEKLGMERAKKGNNEENKIKILIHVHGGMNTYENTNERVQVQNLPTIIKNEKDDWHYPIFISWKSNTASTYGEQLFRIRKGVKANKLIGLIGVPFVFISHLGISVGKIPVNGYYQLANTKDIIVTDTGPMEWLSGIWKQAEKNSRYFSENEFEEPLSINKLCEAINADNYNLTFSTPDNTIKRLNELLETPGFYEEWQPRHSKTNEAFPDKIESLVEETKEYRENLFSKLKYFEKININNLNKLLLQETYPEITPESFDVHRGEFVKLKKETMLKLPYRILTMPSRLTLGSLIHSSFGDTSWENMRRRTSNILFPVHLFDDRYEKEGVAAGDFFKYLFDRIENSKNSFSSDEFQEPFPINKLCKAINDDNYDLELTSTDNTIERLNELLETPDFYEKWQMRHSKTNEAFPDKIKSLVEETKEYRETPFSNLKHFEQINIKNLNKLLLRVTYSEKTPKNYKYEITVVGHSMGAIVLNKVLSLYQEEWKKSGSLRNIVYMAAASSIDKTKDSIIPLFSSHKNDDDFPKFYNLTLNREADIAERNAWYWAPSGSLLVWIDHHYEKPEMQLDRTIGTEVNILSSIVVFNKIKKYVHFKSFDRKLGYFPNMHGDFNKLPFWRESVWKTETRTFKRVVKSAEHNFNCYPVNWMAIDKVIETVKNEKSKEDIRRVMHMGGKCKKICKDFQLKVFLMNKIYDLTSSEIAEALITDREKGKRQLKKKDKSESIEESLKEKERREFKEIKKEIKKTVKEIKKTYTVEDLAEIVKKIENYLKEGKL